VSASTGPIYVGGPDRCGKTLVAAVLGSHSRIAFSAVGSNLWPLFFRQYGDLASDVNAARCVEALLRYKHVAFLRPDGPALLTEFLSGDRTYARLFALLQEQYAARMGKPRWGDQTGLVERYADQIFAAHPDARFIHMVRDPRDRYEASLAMWPEGRLRAGGAAARWLLSTRLARRNAARFGARYRVVRYESLVGDPEGAARELTAFVGETFEPAMLELGAMPDYRAKLEASTGGAGAPTLISADFVGAYRGRIPDADLAFIQHVSGPEMRRHGYRSDVVRFGALQRLRYIGGQLPLNLVRMLAWLGREWLGYRWPSRFGRRPRSGMLVR
jgi:hypothetical protein